MSSRKRARQQRQAKSAGRGAGVLPGQRGGRGGRRVRTISTSYLFAAMIVLFIAVIAAVTLLSRGKTPTCPPGQVWSDAHNHCH